MMAENK